MQAFSTVPGENSILISFQETLTDDIVISHNYFVEKEDPCRSDYYHRPFATSLLDIPIETLLENHQLREESSVKKPLPQVETKSTFSRPLLEDFDKVDNKLWGDKYQVSKYFDLVTDDSLNRESLLWLQTWNEVVFGFESKSSVFGIKPEKPPLKPLLLISGPPGSGKTTLAKVISHHFNYAPHEINCALLGSGKDLLDTLKNSLSIKTVSGKPGILILDQVESIDRATTKALCEILSNKTLKRPTIAITNDLYTSSLIPLRQIAQVMHSKFLSNENLYQRLKEICSNERVYVPEDLLRSLIKENKSDIRACVNTLQLLSSSRSDKQLNVDSSAFRVAGTKEVNLSVFEIWRTVFTEQNSKNVKKAVLSYGDPELINSGIHECYLNSRYSDLSLSKSLTMAESLSFNDVVSRRIRENQQFELYTYQAVCFKQLPGMIANKYCFSQHVDLNFPILERKTAKSIQETEEALKSLKCRKLSNPTQLVLMTDVFPFLPLLISERNLALSKEILENLGFDLSNNLVIPEVKSVVRLPKNFDFNLKTEENNEKQTSQIRTIASQKRKRDTFNGPVFVFHEGLTNAVRRKVRVIDLM